MPTEKVNLALNASSNACAVCSDHITVPETARVYGNMAKARGLMHPGTPQIRLPLCPEHYGTGRDWDAELFRRP